MLGATWCSAVGLRISFFFQRLLAADARLVDGFLEALQT